MRDEKWAELEELLFVFVCTRSTTTWIHILLAGWISLGCCGSNIPSYTEIDRERERDYLVVYIMW